MFSKEFFLFFYSIFHHNGMEEMSGPIRTWEELRFLQVGQSNLELSCGQYCVCSGQLSDLGFSQFHSLSFNVCAALNKTPTELQTFPSTVFKTKHFQGIRYLTLLSFKTY